MHAPAVLGTSQRAMTGPLLAAGVHRRRGGVVQRNHPMRLESPALRVLQLLPDCSALGLTLYSEDTVGAALTS